jgi:hypothetical protein
MSDPEARFMRTGDGGLALAYNVQLAADEEHGFIVDVETVDDPQDASQLPSAMERIKTSLGRYPEQALADGGYTNHPTVVAMAERAIDFYGVMSGRSDAPLGAAGGSDPAYRLDRFRYDEAANEMVCPEGKRLRYHGEHRLPGGRKILTWAARGAREMLSQTEDLQTRPLGIGAAVRSGGRSLRPQDANARSASDLQAARAVDRVSERLD